MTREEQKEYMKKYYAEHREYKKEYQKKYNVEHREDIRKRRSELREEYNASHRKYRAENLNIHGIPKSQIRTSSRRILDKCHTKLPGYEIHHCFGYEDPEKFIYIPKSLHLQIHKLLRDKKISSDSDHWFEIRDLVNSCELYTYIRT